MRLSTTTNAQILDTMMARLGDRAAPKLRTRVLYEVNAYVDGRELQATLPWFLDTKASLDFAVGATSAALPTTFIREVENGQPMLYSGTELIQVLRKTTFDRLDFLGEGPPDHYALIGEDFFIAPAADLAYTVQFHYKAETGDVPDDQQLVSNLWLKYAQNLITFGALQVVANFIIQDADMAARFSTQEKAALDALWRANEARQHVNADYVIED